MARGLIYVGFGNRTPNSGLVVRRWKTVREPQSELDVVDQVDLLGLRGWLQTPRIRGPGFHPAGFVIGIPEKHEISYGTCLDEDRFNTPGPRVAWRSSDPAAGSDQRMHASGSSAAHSTGRRVHHPWCRLNVIEIQSSKLSSTEL